MTKDFQIRQGDVYLFQVETLPEGLSLLEPIKGQHVLAYGESTGHQHSLKSTDCQLFEANDNIKALARKYGVTDDRAVTYGLRIVVDNTQLLHGTPSKGFLDPDHTAIDIPMGDYIVLRPREYSDEDEFKAIAD